MKAVFGVYMAVGIAAIADGAFWAVGWPGFFGSLAGGVLVGSSLGRFMWDS